MLSKDSKSNIQKKGPVWVQTPWEPEPDCFEPNWRSGSRFTKICEPDRWSGSGFTRILCRTGPNWTLPFLCSTNHIITHVVPANYTLFCGQLMLHSRSKIWPTSITHISYYLHLGIQFWASQPDLIPCFAGRLSGGTTSETICTCRENQKCDYMLSPQRDLMYNVGGAVNTLTQTGTACALVLLVNVTRPSLQYGKG